VGFLVLVLFELSGAVESGIVEFEGLEESFDLALRGGFSNGTKDVLDVIRLTEVCKSA
jgi:hypothetical protein